MPNDAALLRNSNPIPAGPGENVDPCIFRGNLKNESSVTVALSGCPFSDTFQVCDNIGWKFTFEVKKVAGYRSASIKNAVREFQLYVASASDLEAN